MKTMKFSLSKYLFALGCLGFFLLGFATFVYGSYRFGMRPVAWRMVGARNALDRTVSFCFHGDDGERTTFMICAQKKLLHDTTKWGTHVLMQALEEKLGTETTDRNFTQCHDLAHAIGWAGTMTTRSVQKTMPQCTNTCVSGCQHGAVSAWYGMGHDLKESITTLCIDGVDWSSNLEAQGGCFHEVGHAVADVSSYDLHASLHLCDRIIPEGRIGCAAGVFMEMYEAATFASAPKPIPDNSPFWCASLWPPYDAYCYDRVGSYEYSKDQDITRVLGICDREPALYRATCVSGISQNIFYVYQHKADFIKEVEVFCRQVHDGMYMPCISGLIRSSILVEPDAKSAIQLCDSLEVTKQLQCFSMIGGVLEERRVKGEKVRICSSLPIEKAQVCTDGVILKH